MVPQLGLCVTLFEVLEVEGGAVHVGEGCALYTVKFSMARLAQPRAPAAAHSRRSLLRWQVFFCPFVGEVLTGKLKSYDANGLRVRARSLCTSTEELLRLSCQVSLGFFDDVVVPASCLQEPSELCVLPRPAPRPRGCDAAARLTRHHSVVDVDAGEKAWKWRYEGNDIFMERDEEVRSHGWPRAHR